MGLEFGLEEYNGPFALRYPRGTAVTAFEEFKQPIVYGEAEVMYYEKILPCLRSAAWWKQQTLYGKI